MTSPKLWIHRGPLITYKTCKNIPGATQKGYLEVEKTCVTSRSDSSCGFLRGRQLYPQLDWARAEVWLQSPRTVQRPRTRAALPPAGQDVRCAGGARLAGIAQCPELPRRLPGQFPELSNRLPMTGGLQHPTQMVCYFKSRCGIWAF